MARPTPDDFKSVIPSPSSSMCGNFVKALLRLPVLVWQYVSALEGGGGGSLAAVPRTGDLIFSAAPVAADATRLLCDGSEYSRTTYANLYTAIGDIYGTPGSSANFKVPDMRARFPVGVGSFPGGGSAVLGAPGGEDVHVMTVAEMPKHNHFACNDQSATGVTGTAPVCDANHTLAGRVVHGGGDGAIMFLAAKVEPDVAANIGKTSAEGSADSTATPPTGGHNNVPPFMPAYVYILT